MVRTRRVVFLMRMRRSSIASSADTAISVWVSMPESRRLNSARPSVKIAW